MSKHTPGPWHLETEDEQEIVLGDSSFIATTHDSSAYSSYTSVTEDQVKANARLIAAAPDLYETLCRMSYIFMQIIQAVEIDIEGTRFEVENKATGEKGHLSLQEVFEAASSAINKVHGETNE